MQQQNQFLGNTDQMIGQASSAAPLRAGNKFVCNPCAIAATTAAFGSQDPASLISNQVLATATCDGTRPACSACVNQGRVCIYPESQPSPKEPVNPDFLQHLHTTFGQNMSLPLFNQYLMTTTADAVNSDFLQKMIASLYQQQQANASPLLQLGVPFGATNPNFVMTSQPFSRLSLPPTAAVTTNPAKRPCTDDPETTSTSPSADGTISTSSNYSRETAKRPAKATAFKAAALRGSAVDPSPRPRTPSQQGHHHRAPTHGGANARTHATSVGNNITDPSNSGKPQPLQAPPVPAAASSSKPQAPSTVQTFSPSLTPTPSTSLPEQQWAVPSKSAPTTTATYPSNSNTMSAPTHATAHLSRPSFIYQPMQQAQMHTQRQQSHMENMPPTSPFAWAPSNQTGTQFVQWNLERDPSGTILSTAWPITMSLNPVDPAPVPKASPKAIASPTRPANMRQQQHQRTNSAQHTSDQAILSATNSVIYEPPSRLAIHDPDSDRRSATSQQPQQQRSEQANMTSFDPTNWMSSDTLNFLPASPPRLNRNSPSFNSHFSEMSQFLPDASGTALIDKPLSTIPCVTRSTPTASSSTSNTTHGIPRSLGSPQVIQLHLLRRFFRYCHPKLPMIDETSFMRTLDRQPPFLLNTMYAIGSTLPVGIDQVSFNQGRPFYDISKAMLSAVTAVPDTGTVVGLVILSFYAAGCGNRESNMLLKIAHDLSVRLGMSRELPELVRKRPISLGHEIRRRVWWNMVEVDRLTAFAFGRPFMIPSDEANVGFPLYELFSFVAARCSDGNASDNTINVSSYTPMSSNVDSDAVQGLSVIDLDDQNQSIFSQSESSSKPNKFIPQPARQQGVNDTQSSRDHSMQQTSQSGYNPQRQSNAPKYTETDQDFDTFNSDYIPSAHGIQSSPADMGQTDLRSPLIGSGVDASATDSTTFTYTNVSAGATSISDSNSNYVASQHRDGHMFYQHKTLTELLDAPLNDLVYGVENGANVSINPDATSTASPNATFMSNGGGYVSESMDQQQHHQRPNAPPSLLSRRDSNASYQTGSAPSLSALNDLRVSTTPAPVNNGPMPIWGTASDAEDVEQQQCVLHRSTIRLWSIFERVVFYMRQAKDNPIATTQLDVIFEGLDVELTNWFEASPPWIKVISDVYGADPCCFDPPPWRVAYCQAKYYFVRTLLHLPKMELALSRSLAHATQDPSFRVAIHSAKMISKIIRRFLHQNPAFHYVKPTFSHYAYQAFSVLLHGLRAPDVDRREIKSMIAIMHHAMENLAQFWMPAQVYLKKMNRSVVLESQLVAQQLQSLQISPSEPPF